MNHLSKGWRLALGATVLGLTAISTSAVLAATTITVWCWDPNFNGAAMQEAADRYTKTHPDVTFNIVATANQNDTRTKMQTQLMSGTTDGLPDILLVEDYAAQKYLQSFPNSFEPVSDKIDMSAFAPYKVAAATMNGKSYSVPFDSGVTGLFYRSDYFAQAGYKADDLADITWDRFIEIAKDVKAKTGHPVLDLDFDDDGLIRMIMQSAGSWYFNDDGSLNVLNNPPLKAALETYGKLWAADIVKPVSGWANYTGGFTTGEVAAVPVGVWMTGTIKSVADQSGKWAVAPLPKVAGIDGATHASNQGGSSWYVMASSPNKDVAIDFLKTEWAGDVDFYQAILSKTGAVGSLLAARTGDVYAKPDDFFGGQKVWQDFSTWIGQIPGVNYGIYTDEVDAAVKAQLPALAKGGSVDEALKAINDQAQAAMQ